MNNALSPRTAEVTVTDIAECLRVLEALVSNRAGLAEVDLETRTRLLVAAGRLSRPERTEQRLLARALGKKSRKAIRESDMRKREMAGIRQKRLATTFVTPDPLLAGANDAFEASKSWDAPELEVARRCYVCKGKVTKVHFFYDQMCGRCGDQNYEKRTQTAELRGRVAFISGARVKIGYQAAIFLLRAGARVVVTTRFPRDAARRYSEEKDFEDFRERLEIYGLDLRHAASVDAFATHLERTLGQLDFVLHNACQTVRRPVGFYGHLMEGELGPLSLLPEHARGLVREHELFSLPSASSIMSSLVPASARASAVAPALSQVVLTPEDAVLGPHFYPEGELDADRQQVDLRAINSWRLPLHEVQTVELLEVQLVNAIAPFVLNGRLKPLMLRQRTFDKHIVNVSAMEGQFYRRFKTDKHPHTNMAKAALNMMTRTSAADYAKDGIYMNSVDTGWVTDEDPAHIARQKAEEEGFSPPLDVVDGAARIVDPIFSGIKTGHHVWGQFLKDYKPTAW
ncbi:MAG TPA: SDR family oxidoreductase [Polyangiaceae bacterium]|jgi:NAD(P)-dependent dehydrogenase (short-subunit alcohol dehydrogenase family)|nr:SDR family oxidoreductase [Polyangiaceae bacterium]